MGAQIYYKCMNIELKIKKLELLYLFSCLQLHLVNMLNQQTKLMISVQSEQQLYYRSTVLINISSHFHHSQCVWLISSNKEVRFREPSNTIDHSPPRIKIIINNRARAIVQTRRACQRYFQLFDVMSTDFTLLYWDAIAAIHLRHIHGYVFC